MVDGRASSPAGASRRAEVWCGTALSVVLVVGALLLPLRAVLLGLSPEALVAVTGSRLAVVALGALDRAEGSWAHWWCVPVATLSIVKFHWVFWWAGRLWGDRVLGRLVGEGRRARRQVARAEGLVRRFQVFALAVAYVPLPLPREPLYAILGASGVRLRTFVLVDVLAAFVSQAVFFVLGRWVGESAVPLLRLYARWAGLVALGLCVVVALGWWRSRRAGRLSRRRRP